MPRIFRNVIYLQIRRRWTSIRFVGWSGRFGEWEGTPEAILAQRPDHRTYALSLEDPKVLGAFSPRAFVAFSHPRVLIDRFEDTELTLQLLLRQICKRRLKATFVVHVRDEWVGGITDVEQRALAELMRNLGSTRTFLIVGPRELSVPEVLEMARSSRPVTQDVGMLIAPP